MTPAYPDVDVRVAREATVTDADGILGEPGELVSLLEHDAAVVLMRSVVDGELVAALSVIPPPASHSTDDELVDVARPGLTAALERLVAARRIGGQAASLDDLGESA